MYGITKIHCSLRYFGSNCCFFFNCHDKILHMNFTFYWILSLNNYSRNFSLWNQQTDGDEC